MSNSLYANLNECDVKFSSDFDEQLKVATELVILSSKNGLKRTYSSLDDKDLTI